MAEKMVGNKRAEKNAGASVRLKKKEASIRAGSKEHLSDGMEQDAPLGIRIKLLPKEAIKPNPIQPITKSHPRAKTSSKSSGSIGHASKAAHGAKAASSKKEKKNAVSDAQRYLCKEPYKKMDYESSLKWLEGITMSGSKPGLERISAFLDSLSNPQKKLKVALIGGTNGKGSTTLFLSSILRAAGYDVGTFISPHIFDIRERIQINSEQISEEEFSDLCSRLKHSYESLAQEARPTFFETITIMAILHYAEKKVDYAVMEIGMGGRLDAANACDPIISVITSIGLDHTKHLGETIDKIAYEKAGIMRAYKPIVCCARGEAKQALMSLAQTKQAVFFDVDAYLHELDSSEDGMGRYIFAISNEQHVGISLNAPGHFQIRNSCGAALAAALLGVDGEGIKKGIQSCRPHARWETVSHKPDLIIDCAHNPPAAMEIHPELMADFFEYPNKRVLVFGAMKDKDYQSVLKLMLPFFDHAIFCTVPTGRAESADNLLMAAKNLGMPARIVAVQDPVMAIAHAKALAGQDGKILCTGSIYLLGHLFGKRQLEGVG